MAQSLNDSTGLGPALLGLFIWRLHSPIYITLTIPLTAGPYGPTGCCCHTRRWCSLTVYSPRYRCRMFWVSVGTSWLSAAWKTWSGLAMWTTVVHLPTLVLPILRGMQFPSCCFPKSTISSMVLLTFSERLLYWHHCNVWGYTANQLQLYNLSLILSTVPSNN